MVTELAVAGLFIAYGDLIVTLAPAAIITSSAKVGTTPPTQVVDKLHSPPAPVLVICATERLPDKIQAINNTPPVKVDRFSLLFLVLALKSENKSALMLKKFSSSGYLVTTKNAYQK
jgi:hypothetical protein